MNQVQRIIKYFALALAGLLIFSIILGIMNVIGALSSIFYDKDIELGKIELLEVSGSFLELDIEMFASNIIFKEGDTFRIETNNKNIYTKEDENKLEIIEKKLNFFNKTNTGDLIIYVPLGFVFDEVSIETGAGVLEIENLFIKELDLNLGAGKVTIDRLNIYNEINIEGGAGEIVIDNSNINNLDLDMGVGKVALTSELKGNNEINAGVGELELNLIGSKDEYKIKVDKGIGSAIIDNSSINSGTYYGNGNRLLDINGGIGSIKIGFVLE